MPESLETLRREVERLRDRAHKLENSMAIVVMQTEQHTRILQGLVDKVEHLQRSDEIATAVAERVNEQRTYVLSTLQKVVIGIFLSAPVINLLLRIFGVEGAP